jgi:D-3-phosphoglycerate dehydrogenase
MAVQEIMDFMENGNIHHSVNYPDCDAGVCTTASRLTICHKNIPNMLTQFTAAFSGEGVNIENLVNKSRGGYAYTIIDAQTEPSKEAVEKIAKIDGVLKVRLIK